MRSLAPSFLRRSVLLAVTLIVSTTLSSTLAAAASQVAGAPGQGDAQLAGSFKDIGDSKFRTQIIWLADKGITAGCAPERFCPHGIVTRGQMASFIARAFDLPRSSRDYFWDDNTNKHENNINRVAAAGITVGCDSGRFCPDGSVTREQMASFLSRALKLRAVDTDYFRDDRLSKHEGNINKIAASGLTSGCGAARYCPSGLVTRGQMAAFLYRALKRPISPPAPIATSGRVFFISPGGSDGAAGTIDAPWRTILHASKALAPGDTLYARGGTYTGQGGYNWATTASGSASAPIVFAAYPGETAVFDGQWRIGNGLILADVGHVTVRGLTFTRYDDQWGGAPLLLLRAHDITIERSTFVDNGKTSQQDHHIYVNSGTRNVVIRNNFMSGTPGAAVHIYHEPGPRNVQIHGNTMRNGFWGVVIGASSDTISITSNVFSGNAINIDLSASSTNVTASGNSPNDVIR